MDHFLNFRPTPGIMTIDEEHHEILRLVNELKKISRCYDSALTSDKPKEDDVWRLRSDDPIDDDDPGPGYEKIRERRRPIYDSVKIPKDDLCHHCNEPVSASGLSLFQKTWCEDHLFCAFCNEELSLEFLFLEIDLQPVCARCYMIAEKGRGGRGMKKSSTLERMRSPGSASGVKRSNSLVRSFRKSARKVQLPGVLRNAGQETEVAVGEVEMPDSPMSEDEFPWRESDG
ncbi:LIMS1 [Branchiostoma lanceolatum]|nr:LIMS1 [Branchiostoma lanceolatum]